MDEQDPTKPSEEPPKQEIVAPEKNRKAQRAATFAGMNADALVKGLPQSIKAWLMGETQTTPPELDRVVDQVASKINMATAFLIVQRLISLGQVMEFLGETQESLLSPERLKGLDAKGKESLYRMLSKDSGDFLEFVRKFTLQNKEMFNKKSQADELANLLRELDPAVVRELIQALSKKGAGTTVNDLKADLGNSKPAKNKTLFEQLMGDEFPDG